jgi:hypothetical protein
MGKGPSPQERKKIRIKRRRAIHNHWKETGDIPFYSDKIRDLYGISISTYRNDLNALSKVDPKFAEMRERLISDRLPFEKAINVFTVDGLMKSMEEVPDLQIAHKHNVISNFMGINPSTVRRMHRRLGHYTDLKDVPQPPAEAGVSLFFQKAIKAFTVDGLDQALKDEIELQKHKRKAISRIMTHLGIPCSRRTILRIDSRKERYEGLPKTPESEPVTIKVKKKKVKPVFNYKDFQAIERGDMKNKVGKLVLRALRNPHNLSAEEKQFFKEHTQYDLMQYRKLYEFIGKFNIIKERLFPGSTKD